MLRQRSDILQLMEKNSLTDMENCKRVRARRRSRGKVRIMDLPTCILVEIFKRLPVKTILKCRTLNKTFSKLLTDTDFLNAHQMQQPLAILLKPFSFGVVTDEYARHLRFLEFGHEQGEVDFTSGKSMRTNIKPIRGYLHVMGSCNGLVCIENFFPSHPGFRSNLRVCNPILGECQILPQGRSADPDTIASGFGVDPSTNLCKVLFIHSKIGGKSHGEIFTVGVDVNWRILELVNCPFFSYFRELVFQGVIHWMVRERISNTEKGESEFIYAFDIGEERFRSILAPPLDMGWKKACTLLVLRNCLCISSFACDDPHELNIWRMKEYGVAESWSKEYSIRENWVSRCCKALSCNISSVKIWGWGDDSVLVSTRNSEFVCCNLDQRKHTTLEIANIKKLEVECTFLPSLMPVRDLFTGRA